MGSRRGFQGTSTQPFMGLALNPRAGVEWTICLSVILYKQDQPTLGPPHPTLPACSSGGCSDGQMAGVEWINKKQDTRARSVCHLWGWRGRGHELTALNEALWASLVELGRVTLG